MKARRRGRRAADVGELYRQLADEHLGETGDWAVVWYQAERDWWFVVLVGTHFECLSFCFEAGDGFNAVRGRPGVELDVYALLAALPRAPRDSGGMLFRFF